MEGTEHAAAGSRAPPSEHAPRRGRGGRTWSAGAPARSARRACAAPAGPGPSPEQKPFARVRLSPGRGEGVPGPHLGLRVSPTAVPCWGGRWAPPALPSLSGGGRERTGRRPQVTAARPSRCPPRATPSRSGLPHLYLLGRDAAAEGGGGGAWEQPHVHQTLRPVCPPHTDVGRDTISLRLGRFC